jgi:hypothetical protein
VIFATFATVNWCAITPRQPSVPNLILSIEIESGFYTEKYGFFPD